MASKKNITFNIEANSKSAVDGINKVNKQLENLSKSTKQTSLDKFSKLGSVVSGTKAAFDMFSATVKAVNAAINDLTESYKTQAKAEIQLETAAKNNPYLDESSVRQLKNYASELQSISTVGDETLIPMMARLAAAGRTQSEIQNVMSAALDLSASGTMSLEQAVSSLNATYQGNAGLLGKQNAAIKNLTAEQLKNGEAVKIIAEQYKGMAAETAKATGSAEQLSNAWGDLKENIGSGIEKAVAPLRRAFTNLLTDINNVISRSKELKNANENISSGNATAADYDVKIEQAKEKLLNYQKLLEKYKKEYAETGIDNGIAINAQAMQEQIDLIRQYEIEKGKLVSITQEQAAAEKQASDEATRAADLQKILDKHDATIAKAKLEAEAKGEAVSEQTKLNAAMSTYLELAADPRFEKETEEWKNKTLALVAAAKSAKELEEVLSKMENTANEKLNAANSLLGGGKEAKLSEAIAATIAALEEQKKKFAGNTEAAAKLAEKIKKLESILPKVKLAELNADMNAALPEGYALDKGETARLRELNDQKLKLEEEFRNAQKELAEKSADERADIERRFADAIAEIDRQILDEQTEINKQRLQQAMEIVNQIKGYVDQTIAIMKDASNLMLETVRNNSAAELATLEKQYLDGEISEEEYEEKKLEAKKKAAKEEYKIQMFQWSASILQATANIAQGVTQAIAQGGVMGIITGAIVAAAGAVQIASIVASKPTPPAFATGGFVPGTSYSGDRVPIMANSGEAVLNAAQQRNFLALANGQNGGGNQVIINNSASNIVSATPKIDKGKIELWIDARVNEGLRSGRYDQSLTMAQQGMDGDFYGT